AKRQAVYDLLKCFLEKRSTPGIDCKKDLPGLLVYGFAKGCFIDPNEVFEREQWKVFGDKIFDAATQDDKVAKKMMKLWRAVSNALAQYEAEQKAAAATAQCLGTPLTREKDMGDSCLLPPTMNTFTMQTGKVVSDSVFSPPASPQAVSAPSASLEHELLPTAPPFEQSPTAPPQPPPPESRSAALSLPSEQASSSLSVNTDSGIQEIAKEREEFWREVAKNIAAEGDIDSAREFVQAFPVEFSPPNAQGQIIVNIRPLDWKVLTQLRATVNESGLKGEPTHQMLDYLWGSMLLLPNDIKNITKLILTQHQRMLFGAYWQTLCQQSVAMQRGAGDPLHGVTLEELMGQGNYTRREAQALIGPDKVRESMNLARRAIDQIKQPGGLPSYMSIKQGRDEPFGTFIDHVANAILATGLPDYMHGILLKQCAIQNCNPTARSVLVTLPATWTIEEALERMSQVPVGPQAMIVNAIKELGKELGIGMKQQAEVAQRQIEASQSQVLAALAPLQNHRSGSRRQTTRLRRFRCGVSGHMRRDCNAGNVWCQHCRLDTHASTACRRSGNGKSSGKARPAMTPKAAAYPATQEINTCTPLPTLTSTFVSSPQPGGASDWTWQSQ
ncbi:GA113 protein, partial [Corvus moneduloides]|nr:GA113 protein [Corvus moneduloides]